MFKGCSKKAPVNICSWKIKQNKKGNNIKGSSVKNANVVKAPDGLATEIFPKDPFRSHTKKAEQMVQVGI